MFSISSIHSSMNCFDEVHVQYATVILDDINPSFPWENRMKRELKINKCKWNIFTYDQNNKIIKR